MSARLSAAGFSIVGVLVAAGMMGGLALLLTRISKNQMVFQKKAETGAELLGLHRRILAVLYDGDACLETLKVLPGTLHNGRTLGELKNKGGTAVVTRGADINRMLRVDQMEVQDVSGVGQTKEANIHVTIKHLGVANQGKVVKKVFPLTVEMDTSTPPKIVRCHHTLDSKEHGIKTRMCTEMGGRMVTIAGSPTSICSIDNLFRKFCENMYGNYRPHPDMKCDISDIYVNTTGDRMTGTLSGVELIGSGAYGPSPCPSGYQESACGTLPDRELCVGANPRVRKWKALDVRTVASSQCYKCGWDVNGPPPAGHTIVCP